MGVSEGWRANECRKKEIRGRGFERSTAAPLLVTCGKEARVDGGVLMRPLLLSPAPSGEWREEGELSGGIMVKESGE